MDHLLDIQEKLLDTNSEIARLTRVIAEQPDSIALQAMAKSLRKRRQMLEQQFEACTSRS